MSSVERQQGLALRRKLGLTLIVLVQLLALAGGVMLVVDSRSEDSPWIAAALIIVATLLVLPAAHLFVTPAPNAGRRQMTDVRKDQAKSLVRRIATLILALGAIGLVLGLTLAVTNIATGTEVVSWPILGFQAVADLVAMMIGYGVRRSTGRLGRE